MNLSNKYQMKTTLTTLQTYMCILLIKTALKLYKFLCFLFYFSSSCHPMMAIVQSSMVINRFNIQWCHHL